MAINVNCACGAQYQVRDEFAGRQVECAGCHRVLTVPAAGPGRQTRLTPPPAPRAGRGPSLRRPAPDRDFQDEDASPRRGALPWVAAGLLVVGLLGLGAAAVVFVLSQQEPTPPDRPTAETPAPTDLPPQGGQPGSPAPPPSPGPGPGPTPPAEGKPWGGHSSPILAVAFSRDGTYALSASGGLEDRAGRQRPAADASLRRWEADSGKEVGYLAGFPKGIACAAFAPGQGRALLATAGASRGGADGGAEYELQLWDIDGKRAVRAFEAMTRPITCVALSPDGRLALSGGADRALRLWDTRTGACRRVLEGHTGGVTCTAFSPDGHFALSGSLDHTARLWDLDEGKYVRSFTEHQDAVRSVAFSPDGRTAASAGGRTGREAGGDVPASPDHDVRLWDVDTGKELKRLEGHRDAVAALAFAPDGRRLLSGSDDRSVRLWQVASGQELGKFEGHTGRVNAVAFFPDGRRALSGGDDKVLRVWELPPDAADLVKALGDKNPRARLEAVRALARLGPDARPAVPALLEALAGPDADLRPEALQALKRIGPPAKQQVPQLVPLLRNGALAEARLYALDSLVALGPDARPATSALVGALKDRDDTVRRKAAQALGGIGREAREQSYAALVEVLRDPDAEVSAAAGAALARMGPPTRDQVPALERFLEDPASPVRRHALDALAELGGDAAAAVPALARVAARDSSADLRGRAVRALVKVAPGSKEAVEAFTRALGDADAAVALQAVRALGEVKVEDGPVPGLVQALDHPDPDVSKAADEVLQRLRLGKAHAGILVKGLTSRKAAVRLRLIEALGRLGPDAAEAVPGLCRALKGADSAERLRILGALRRIGPAAREAAPQLADLLKEEKDSRVDLEVCLTLAELGEQVDKAVPFLVRALRVENIQDDEAVKAKDKAQEALVKIGKPAVHGLVVALQGDFLGGPRAANGAVNGRARFEVIRTLAAMGAKARSTEVLLALARVERSDGFLEVRMAAKEARVKLQRSE